MGFGKIWSLRLGLEKHKGLENPFLEMESLGKNEQPEGPPNERGGSLVMGPLPLVPVFSQLNGEAFKRRKDYHLFFVFERMD